MASSTKPDEIAVSVWTLQTWMHGDPPEGFGYGYPSRESAVRNGRVFEEDERGWRWQVVAPTGVITDSGGDWTDG